MVNLKTEEQIYERIKELERDKIAYLEVGDKTTVRRKAKQIEQLEDKLELFKLNKIKEELRLYKEFVQRRGLNSEFQCFEIQERKMQNEQ